MQRLRHFLQNLRKSEQISLKSARIATKFEKIAKHVCIPLFENAKRFDESCPNIEVRAVQKHVNLVDFVKSFPTSSFAKFGVDTAENEPLKVLLVF